MVRRGREAGRRLADASLAAAARRPAMARIVPAGALLVATTGGAASLALGGDADTGSPSASGTGAVWRPPAPRTAGPQVLSPGTRVTAVAWATPAGGTHRADHADKADKADSAGQPAGGSASTVGGRHRATETSSSGRTGPAQDTRQDGRQEPQSSQQTTQQSAQSSTPAAQPTASASAPPASGAPTPQAPATPAADGGLVAGVLGTVGGVVDGLLGGGTGR